MLPAPRSRIGPLDRLPNRNVLATFQQKGDSGGLLDGLVELTPEGAFVRGGDAADPMEPNLL